MRLANVGGRAALVVGDRAVDVERASGGRFGADPQALFDDWAAFRAWAEQATDAAAPAESAEPIDPGALGAPVPRPRQVFAIGVNYTEHAAEAGYPPDSVPVTFTKFPSCIVGQDVAVELPSDVVDWEVELVVAIGARAHHVASADAWDHVAGVTIGQDLSERVVQMVGTKPQFSLGKSFPGFGPTGPWLVTPDELPDSRRPRAELRPRRRRHADRSHLADDLHGAAARRAPVGDRDPAARRPRLHRHAGRHRQRPHAQALPPAGTRR